LTVVGAVATEPHTAQSPDTTMLCRQYSIVASHAVGAISAPSFTKISVTVPSCGERMFTCSWNMHDTSAAPLATLAPGATCQRTTRPVCAEDANAEELPSAFGDMWTTPMVTAPAERGAAPGMRRRFGTDSGFMEEEREERRVAAVSAPSTPPARPPARLLLMKLKQLESALSQGAWAFPSPDVSLEQYPTSAHLASRLLFAANASFEDIEARAVFDLGCGTGILSVGASYLDAHQVVGIDVDPAALLVAASNAQEADVEFVQADVLSVPWLFHSLSSLHTDASAPANLLSPQDFKRQLRASRKVCDTVVMNPPFGTRAAGVDVQFLQAALLLCEASVYSLHKTSTRDFLVNKCQKDWGVGCEVVAQLKFDVPNTYAFHKKKSVDIAVDVLRVFHKEE
jgi:predicted RNA methylase